MQPICTLFTSTLFTKFLLCSQYSKAFYVDFFPKILTSLSKFQLRTKNEKLNKNVKFFPPSCGPHLLPKELQARLRATWRCKSEKCVTEFSQLPCTAHFPSRRDLSWRPAHLSFCLRHFADALLWTFHISTFHICKRTIVRQTQGLSLSHPGRAVCLSVCLRKERNAPECWSLVYLCYSVSAELTRDAGQVPPCCWLWVWRCFRGDWVSLQHQHQFISELSASFFPPFSNQLHSHAFPFGAVNCAHLQSSAEFSLWGCFTRWQRRQAGRSADRTKIIK